MARSMRAPSPAAIIGCSIIGYSTIGYSTIGYSTIGYSEAHQAEPGGETGRARRR
jgi:hypothetical protein